MNIKQDNIDSLNAIVTIKLQPTDYLPKVNNSIENHRKKVNLPGFRKGMVPTGHIKKLYGKSILVDEINTLLSDSLNKYIDEQKLEVLGQPLPKMDPSKEFRWEEDEEFEFMFELGIAPAFDVNFSSKDKFNKYVISIDEDTLTKRMQNLRRSYGKMTNPDVSAAGDVLYVEMEQLASDGTIYEGGINHTNSLRLDLVEDKAIANALTGLKKGDVLNIDLVKAFNKDPHRIAHLLNIDEETAAQLKSAFRLNVKNVNRIQEAELNEEFFEKIYPGAGVKTEAEFKAKLILELENMMVDNAGRKLQTDIRQYAMDKFKLKLPDTFLKKWLHTANEGKLTVEQIETQYNEFAQNLKWTLIENKIMKNNNIELKTQDVIELTKKRIMMQFSMYGAAAPSQEQLNEYAVDFLKDRERATKIYDELRGMEVFEYIKSVVTLEDKKIAYNKFVELK